jgi:hypothetical protein
MMSVLTVKVKIFYLLFICFFLQERWWVCISARPYDSLLLSFPVHEMIEIWSRQRLRTAEQAKLQNSWFTELAGLRNCFTTSDLHAPNSQRDFTAHGSDLFFSLGRINGSDFA